MKKTALILTSVLMANAISFADELSNDSIVTTTTTTVTTTTEPADTPDTKSKAYKILLVKGPLKEDVNAYTITFNYSSDDISKAIAARLKNEGLSSSKAKNKFTAYKEVKYNPLWSKLCDMYIAVNGSSKEGTVYFVLSTGYDNYIHENDYAETDEKISAWLVSLEADVQSFILENRIKEQEKVVKEAEKELKKLQNKKKSLEGKINSKDKELRKLDAIRTVPDKDYPGDPKLIAKEKKQYEQLTIDKQNYEVDLSQVESNIEQAQTKLNAEKQALADLKAQRK